MLGDIRARAFQLRNTAEPILRRVYKLVDGGHMDDIVASLLGDRPALLNSCDDPVAIENSLSVLYLDDADLFLIDYGTPYAVRIMARATGAKDLRCLATNLHTSTGDARRRLVYESIKRLRSRGEDVPAPPASPEGYNFNIRE